mmetsp:Transcript_10297/g.26373  ORF Transcript_10297/g.26373 Transcript_10297/m.26373 type:complete len:498 (-) Transcript_10297:208-1701(-)
MSAIKTLNPKAEVARAAQAIQLNISAAIGLQSVLSTNLGPKGTMKMLVSGSGDIKITKDGLVLLNEMQIQHPTAALIARAATAQDDVTGDGTTSNVIMIGEMLKMAERRIDEGMHPRVLADGYDIARDEAIKVLEKLRVCKGVDRSTLLKVAQTSLRTKIHAKMADQLTEIVTDAVLNIKAAGEIDLFMVEIMMMMHRSDTDTRLVKGLVMDHGARHPNMPKELKNAYVLTCNVSLEYEKTEVNAGFFYKTAEEREKMVKAEREFIDRRVEKIIAFKKKLCDGTDKTFIVINQKGIDPPSLDMLAAEGIVGLRRAKRRNMERITLACGGQQMNSVDDLDEECLGYAGHIYEHVLGEQKFTFLEEVKNPKSVSILIKGPNRHTLAQIKDAVHDGLRAVKNAIDDDCVVPGAGAVEMAIHNHLRSISKSVKGKARLGVDAYAEAILVIPKTLAKNSGCVRRLSTSSLRPCAAAHTDLRAQQVRCSGDCGEDAGVCRGHR